MAAWSIRGARPKATLVPGNGPRRPKGMAIVEVDHVHKRYRDAVAVEDVSFAVERGEIFAILGPNGAGKTTAVEIVEGLRVPDRGAVRVLGLDPGGTGPSCGGASASSSSRASCPSR
jgi:ABC-type molybdenum transport system ATPase subunit/photorepair protein PhrA